MYIPESVKVRVRHDKQLNGIHFQRRVNNVS